MTSTIGVMQFVVQLAQEMMADGASRHVHAMDDRLHLFTLRRRRQEDDPCARADVLLEILAPRERPGALEHELDAQLLPGEIQRVAAAQRPQLAAGDDQVVSVDRHGLRVPPVHRVEAKQVGEVLDVDQVVDGDQLERRLVDHQLQDRASDSSQTVDGDSGAHSALPARKPHDGHRRVDAGPHDGSRPTRSVARKGPGSAMSARAASTWPHVFQSSTPRTLPPER